MKKKGIALIAALVLLAVSITAGSLAWLTDTTDAVTNTFTTSNITVELTETEETYKMIPGYSIHKDPAAKVTAGSEECYLFVKLVKSDNFDNFMTYDVETGEGNWTKLDGEGEVYYRIVKTADMGNSYSVLKGNQVTVKDSVTKEQMNALTEATYPTLTVTAYACQLNSTNDTPFEVADAWAKVKPTTPTT